MSNQSIINRLNQRRELVFLNKNLLQLFKLSFNKNHYKCYTIKLYCKNFDKKSVLDSSMKAIILESILRERYILELKFSYKTLSAIMDKIIINSYIKNITTKQYVDSITLSSIYSKKYKMLNEIAYEALEKIKKIKMITKFEAAINTIESAIKNPDRNIALIGNKSSLTKLLKTLPLLQNYKSEEIIYEI